MKTKNFTVACTELDRLKGLNDDNEYCITSVFFGKGAPYHKVGIKTKEQKDIDNINGSAGAQKVTDFIKNYNLTQDIH